MSMNETLMRRRDMLAYLTAITRGYSVSDLNSWLNLARHGRATNLGLYHALTYQSGRYQLVRVYPDDAWDD